MCKFTKSFRKPLRFCWIYKLEARQKAGGCRWLFEMKSA